VSDVDGGRAAALAQSVGAQAEAGWETLIERPDVDGVIVSTPPHTHAEIGIAALRAGKDVLCEKPLARTPAEAQHMVDTASAAGRYLATGFNYRFYPSVQKARELLESGMIGELDHIRSYAGYSATDHNPAWVHDAATMGGGALRDNGIHLIDLTRYFLGDAVEVQGLASESVWRFAGCEDNGFALLRNAAGNIASVHASWTEWQGYRLLVEIYGTRGCIRTSCFPMRTQVVWSDRLGGRMKRRTYSFLMTMVAEHLRSYRELVVRSFVDEFSEFEKARRGESSALASGLDGLRALEIAHSVAHAPEPALLST
jgi:predicted dehydrogenase